MPKGNLKTNRSAKFQPNIGNNKLPNASNNFRTTNRNNNTNNISCNNCGELGHTRYECKFDKANKLQCEYCGKLGHHSTICRSRILISIAKYVDD